MSLMQRRSSYRPRQMNIFKTMEIMREEGGRTFEDEASGPAADGTVKAEDVVNVSYFVIQCAPSSCAKPAFTVLSPPIQNASPP